MYHHWGWWYSYIHHLPSSLYGKWKKNPQQQKSCWTREDSNFSTLFIYWKAFPVKAPLAVLEKNLKRNRTYMILKDCLSYPCVNKRDKWTVLQKSDKSFHKSYCNITDKLLERRITHRGHKTRFEWST